MDTPLETIPNSAKSLENWVNTKHRVLGKTLQPFCLLHLQWLEYINSPLFLTSKEATIADVELAVLICSSRSNAEILRKLKNNTLPRFLWRWLNRRKKLERELRAFIAYQDDYCSLPEFSAKEEGGETDSKLPWILLQLATLVKETGWKQEDVAILPVGQVVWLNCAFSYLRTGETGIVSDKEKAAMQALDELERQLTGGA